MKKLTRISLILLLLLVTACSAPIDEGKQNSGTEEKVKTPSVVVPEASPEAPPKVPETKEPVEQKKPDTPVTPAPKFKRVQVELSRPVDGDTIEVIYNGKAESVRFLLVDTPETHHPRLGKQPFGEEAKAFTSKMVQDANKIELEFDIGPQRDKYSRLLAYVYVDGKMLQEELLKRGLARVAYVYPPSTRYVDQFRSIQEKSQQQGIGIWSVENYAKQDGFHPEVMQEEAPKQQEPTKTTGCKIKGNINSKGDKIYHVPGGAYYDITKPEQCFDTEKAAQAAGFRKSMR